jgi:hypothetical protein
MFFGERNNMKTIIATVCFALLAMPALAATNQQEKIKACNAAAEKKGLKGDQRKAYVKACVSAEAKAKPDAAAKPEKKAARPASPPATPAPAKPSATSTAASPSGSNTNSATEKKRLKCDDLARQSNVSPSTKKAFMDKCVAG